MRVFPFASMRSGILVSALAALLLVTTGARAEDRSLAEAITVASADECFALESLLEHVEAFLGRATIDAHLAAVVEAGDGTASFEILRDGSAGGRRRFARLPRSCADRRAVVALALALALDESAAITPTREQPAPVAGDARAAPLPGTDPASVGGAPPFGVQLQVGAGVLVGVLPVPAPMLTVDLVLVPVHALSIGFGGVVTTSVDAAIGRGSAGTDLVGGRISACLERGVGRGVLSFGGCVGAWLAAVHAQGDGFASDRAGTAPWLAVAARVQLTATAASWLALFAAIDGLAVPLAPTLEVAAGDEVAARVQLGRAGVALSVGLALLLR